jgi:transcriptional regulator
MKAESVDPRLGRDVAIKVIPPAFLSRTRRADELSMIRVCWAGMPKPADLLQGTLDLLILKTLAREPVHGWGISKRIQQFSDEELSVGQGSLYPALYRLEQQGWITATWQETDLGRRAKFYASREGRAQLNRELQTWKRLSSAVVCCSARVIGGPR